MEWIDRFFQGFQELAQAHHVFLLGGDTTRSPDTIVINSLVIGSMQTSQVKYRSQARVGDFICCTGFLGDSGAGLKILLEKLPINSVTQPLVHEHVRPRPHLPEGQCLANQTGVHAMMDMSDGLDSDIRRIMEKSACGSVIRLDHLPASPSLLACAKIFGWFAPEIAATPGEDYCLLLTVDSQAYESINQGYTELFERPLFKIGEITAGSSLNYLKDGKSFQLARTGFDHFSNHIF